MDFAGVEAGAKMLVGLEVCPEARARPKMARMKQRQSLMLAPARVVIALLYPFIEPTKSYKKTNCRQARYAVRQLYSGPPAWAQTSLPSRQRWDAALCSARRRPVVLPTVNARMLFRQLPFENISRWLRLKTAVARTRSLRHARSKRFSVLPRAAQPGETVWPAERDTIVSGSVATSEYT